jgi:hypothetical protein
VGGILIQTQSMGGGLESNNLSSPICTDPDLQLKKSTAFEGDSTLPEKAIKTVSLSARNKDRFRSGTVIGIL